MKHPHKLIIVGDLDSGHTKVKIGDYHFLYEQSLLHDKLIKKYIVKVLIINTEEFNPMTVEKGDRIVFLIKARSKMYKKIEKYEKLGLNYSITTFDGTISREDIVEMVHDKMIDRVAFEF